MNYRFGVIAAICGCLLSSCAAIQSTEDVALRYNRAFANTRNEMLVLNVLRSAAREPMQFSTMGVVNGAVGNGGSITIPFTNVIAGGPDIISPSIQITDAVNPSITLTPLGAQDFVRAILTPMTPEDVQLFLHGAWDAEFLLPLIVGSVVCPDGRVLHNRGEFDEPSDRNRAYLTAFRDFFASSAPGFQIDTEATEDNRVLVLTDREAADFLRQGAGPDYTIESVAEREGGGKLVTIRRRGQSTVSGLAIDQLCRDIPDERSLEQRNVRSGMAAQGLPVARSRGRVILRSVQTIIYFLGETHRERMEPGAIEPLGFVYMGPRNSRDERDSQILFRLRAEPSGSTAAAAVAVPFQGQRYSISSLRLGEPEPEPRDRTLKTLSFLDQLIALQTSESIIRGTQPLLTTAR